MTATAHGSAARRAPASDLSTPDSAKRSLCALVFRDVGAVTSVRRHRVRNIFTIDRHRHADLLQIDVLDHCGGTVQIGDRIHDVGGFTLMMTPPGVEHGYSLRAEGEKRREAWVHHIKVRVDRPWAESAASPPLPNLLTNLSVIRVIATEMDRFSQAWSEHGMPFGALVSFAEAIAAWPRSASDLQPEVDLDLARGGATVLQRVRSSVESFGLRHADPPSLEELAAEACLSPRHFARVFQSEYRCTPHAYLSARRLEAAREQLLRDDCRINEVASALGFGSPAAFSRWFNRLAGQSPRDFRNDPTAF